MVVWRNCQLLLLCLITVTINAQTSNTFSRNVGDAAPPLRIREWIKGKPFQKFENGKFYVIEFWASWCKPCIAAMPHISRLAAKYKDKIAFLGVDILENKTTSTKKIKSFVDSMGLQMNYAVAIEDSSFMVTGWLDAFDERGIPKTFVINTEGRVAWIGQPKELDEALSKIINNEWNIKEVLAKRNLNRRLEELDDSLNYELKRYIDNPFKPGDLGKPDSALLEIHEIVSNEPSLKYAPIIANHTFYSLLKTNPHKAYEYGKTVITTSTYTSPAFDAIIGPIEWYSDKLNLPLEIYQLGAEAYQAKIDSYPYPEIVNIPKLYHKMAEWYWRAKDKSKAINAIQKAIQIMKDRKNIPAKEIDVLESLLKQYKKM